MCCCLLQMRGDVMGRFQNALYLGDVREQVCVCVCGRIWGFALFAC